MLQTDVFQAAQETFRHQHVIPSVGWTRGEITTSCVASALSSWPIFSRRWAPMKVQRATFLNGCLQNNINIGKWSHWALNYFPRVKLELWPDLYLPQSLREHQMTADFLYPVLQYLLSGNILFFTMIVNQLRTWQIDNIKGYSLELGFADDLFLEKFNLSPVISSCLLVRSKKCIWHPCIYLRRFSEIMLWMMDVEQALGQNRMFAVKYARTVLDFYEHRVLNEKRKVKAISHFFRQHQWLQMSELTHFYEFLQLYTLLFYSVCEICDLLHSLSQ